MSTDKPAHGGLAGLVTDSSGNPLSGVKIATTEASTMSDVYGKWALSSLQPQITQVIASRENYQAQTRNVEVLSGETVSGVNFSLPSDSEIYDIIVSDVTSSRARITFYTRFQSRASIKYGANALMDKNTAADAELVFQHQYQLEGLTPATTWKYQCLATDKTGRTLASDIRTFNTPATTRGVSPTGLELAKAANSNAIQLKWNADSSADFAGFNIYRAQSVQGPFSLVGSGVVMQNSYLDNNVRPGVKYYYRITRLSGSGDESSPSTTEPFLMPGILSENVVWTVQESPYYLTGDLIIAANASLVVDKGVTVSMARGDQWDADSAGDLIDITVQGTLMVQGTTAQ
ncbi:MAG: carboxypeptidase regulatory-like domain-containing protein, partial [Candidatus Riflebacteria bacterium]|nr:carboxypeptidase regulatory-like domain-containing protein [Candidatus Riflebacteria bacterium]